jgi:hypothetical protein
MSMASTQTKNMSTKHESLFIHPKLMRLLTHEGNDFVRYVLPDHALTHHG